MSDPIRPETPPAAPIDRLMAAHRASLRPMCERRRSADAVPATRQLDAAQCRIQLNAAEREISRLRRGIDRPDLCRTVRREAAPAPPDDCPPDALAAPPTERKAYAVDPVGKPPPPQRDAPPAEPQWHDVVNHYRGTSLGTFVDLFA